MIRGANFTEANFKSAKFNKSNCTEADFTKADLTGARFVETSLTEAKFHDAKLAETVGSVHGLKRVGVGMDVVPLPHPSGASTWIHTEPGKTLLRQALELLANHREWRALVRG